MHVCPAARGASARAPALTRRAPALGAQRLGGNSPRGVVHAARAAQLCKTGTTLQDRRAAGRRACGVGAEGAPVQPRGALRLALQMHLDPRRAR
jgi:hypothetical protein